MKRTFFLCLAIILGVAVFAEAGSPNAGSTENYVIANVDFDIEGVTLEFVLREKADIQIGRRFPNLPELEAYLADRRQILVNERVLEDAEVHYDIGEPDADGMYPVFVHMLVKDSWNVIALPKPQFDSNSGFLLSIRARDYNFLGSMQTLTLNLDYTYDENGRSGFGGYSSFTIPFQLGEYVFSLGLSEDIRLYADETPTSNATTASASATYYGFGFPLTATLSQAFTTNPDGDLDDPDPYFMTSSSSVSASIELAENWWGLGPLTYTPTTTISRMWRFDAPIADEDRKGLIVTLVNTLAWGRVDWIRNMKQGFSTSIWHTDYYYFRDGSWVFDLDGTATAAVTYKGLVSFKTRLEWYYRFFGSMREDVGDNVRGVLDARIDGTSGVFLNFDFPIKLFDFPTHLIIGKDWLDFELQASPFFDAALVRPSETSPVNLDDLWLGGGLELIVYPLRMRNFIVRGSLGFDLKNVAETGSLTAETPDGTSPYELFFGLGLLY